MIGHESMRTVLRFIMWQKPLHPITPLIVLQPHIPLHSLKNPIYNTHTAVYSAMAQPGEPITVTKNSSWLEMQQKKNTFCPLFICCYLATWLVRPCEITPLSLRCRSSLSSVSRISLSTAVSVSSRGLRYDKSSRPESSELGDRVEDKGGSLGTGGRISL